jgi:hypothetical protein
VKVEFPSPIFLSLLIQDTEYYIITDFPKGPIDKLFEKRENKNSYTIYWDVSLNIKENEMIWSVIFKLKNGQHKAKTRKDTRKLKDEGNPTKIFGSLASRFNGPVKPRSELDPQPVTPRKRGRNGNTPPSRRKSSRLAGRPSPHLSESDDEYQPAGFDKDTSDDESQIVLPEEDYYGLSD